MVTTIYYFSGTGNSLKIAKDLADKIEDSIIIPIAKVWDLENLESKSEKIGFIFPLYYSGLPKIVVDFINRIDLSKSTYFFTVITSAGDINEQPLQQMDNILKSKLKKLNAGFFITMPSNYIIGYDVASKEKQKKLFELAIKHIDTLSKTVINKEDNISQEILQKDVRRSERVNRTFLKKVYESDESFHTDDRCTSCGICENICPVNNIILVDGKPQWQHRCQQCLACINYCPEKSVQFGKKTLKTLRYHHPEITIQEIINQKE